MFYNVIDLEEIHITNTSTYSYSRMKETG